MIEKIGTKHYVVLQMTPSEALRVSQGLLAASRDTELMKSPDGVSRWLQSFSVSLRGQAILAGKASGDQREPLGDAKLQFVEKVAESGALN